MVKKHQIAPFLNKAVDSETGLVDKTTPDWMRICMSTAFDLNMNPETEDRDYICDEALIRTLETKQRANFFLYSSRSRLMLQQHRHTSRHGALTVQSS